VIVEALLDSGMIGLVMSSEFAQKQRFKLKKINIYYWKHRKRTEIDVIGGQKCNFRNIIAYSL